MKQWLYKNAFCSWGLMDPTRARITGVAVAGSSLRVRHTLDTSLAQRHIHVWGLLKVIFLFKIPNKEITFWVPNLTHSAPSVLPFEVTSLWFGPPTYKLIHLMLLPHIYLFISLFESCDHPCRRLPHSAVIVVCCCCPRWPPPGRSASNLPIREGSNAVRCWTNLWWRTSDCSNSPARSECWVCFEVVTSEGLRSVPPLERPQVSCNVNGHSIYGHRGAALYRLSRVGRAVWSLKEALRPETPGWI